MLSQNFAALIFDFDGVIIDSEPLHAEAKRLTLEHFQIPYPPGLFSNFKGRTDADFFYYVASELAQGSASESELDGFKRQQYLVLFEEVKLVPGVLDFIKTARRKFARIGLASSATLRDFSLAMHKYPLESWFDVIITGEDTLRHKPHPEPYLKALAALRVSAADSLVIEDSPNGILSAKSACCTVIAITTTFSAAQLSAAGADFVVPSFAGLEQALGLT
jgi:beta-phosphoglucomutase